MAVQQQRKVAPGAAAELGGGGGAARWCTLHTALVHTALHTAAGFVCSKLVHGAPTPKAIVAAFPGIEETRRLALAPSLSHF